jgi:hypothetical protein
MRFIGMSEDITVRVQQHNDGISKWTKGKGPWVLRWTSEAMSISEARKLENCSNAKRAMISSEAVVRTACPKLLRNAAWLLFARVRKCFCHNSVVGERNNFVALGF